jgi:hypothetical protein
MKRACNDEFSTQRNENPTIESSAEVASSSIWPFKNKYFQMKRILMLSVVAAIAFAGCKKKENTVSRLVNVSYPTVKITSGQYFSFKTGGGPLPNINTIHATAYDSFYHETLTPVVDASLLSNVAPGLYIATVSAKNSNGFTGYAYVYVAITDAPDTMDISGLYWLKVNGNASSKNPALVTKKAAGLYLTSNVAGVDTSDHTMPVIPAVFVVNGNLATLDFGSQPTSVGILSAANAALIEGPTDTTLNYSIDLSGFDGKPRTFIKQ